MKSVAHQRPSLGKYAAVNLHRNTLDLPRKGSFWREWGAFLGIAALCVALMAVVAFGVSR